MDWVQDANKNNVLSVEDGLGQINGAKDEADKIGRMQTDSKEMVTAVISGQIPMRALMWFFLEIQLRALTVWMPRIPMVMHI